MIIGLLDFVSSPLLQSVLRNTGQWIKSKNSVILLEKVLPKIVQRNTDERGMLNASHFGFLACRSKTLQCMSFMDH
jgi:hypothetical protein